MIHGRRGKIYGLGIVLICGFLLVSADDCESMYQMDGESYAREQAVRAEQERANAARMQQEAAAWAEFGSQQQTAQAGTSQTGQASQASQAAPASQTAQAAADGIIAPAGVQPAQTEPAGSEYVTSISGRSWKLIQLRFSDRTVVLNRNELSGGMEDIFTLNIDNERISGRGAPNRYFSSYRAGANNALTILPIASTLMASIFSDPERIREVDYFKYLGNVKSWRLSQNRLELVSVDAGGRELIMVYSN
jgi:heat shock protein HslJ